MAEKGSFLFRTNPKMLAALKRWSEDEFRSTNGQLEYILRQALRHAGRLSDAEAEAGAEADGRRSAGPGARRNTKRKPAAGR
jgi:hypothetical protein